MQPLWNLWTWNLVALLMAMVLPRLGAATLWKTEAQLTTQYGETVEIRRDSDDRTFTFQANDLRIEVKFLGGISQSVTYQHSDDTKPLTSKEIESFLEDNSGGKRWLRKDKHTWELGMPAVATASMYTFESTHYTHEGREIAETRHLLRIETTAFDKSWSRQLAALHLWPSHTGWEKRFRGKLEFKDEEDEKRVAIVRDGASVLEIPWSSKYYPEKAHLEAGKLYDVTVRDDEAVDMDASMVFVSDRVHKSHGDRVIDSEWFTLVRIKDDANVVYDEAVCEVHHTRMQRVRAKVGYGMYGPATEADAVCDKEYPHHADWIRGGCVVGDVKTARHYVCADCVAATAKYKREHVNDEKPTP